MNSVFVQHHQSLEDKVLIILVIIVFDDLLEGRHVVLIVLHVKAKIEEILL